jgi:diacylglycerol kinase family enzyme
VRALLIVNPFATSTTDAGRDALADTLSAKIDLTVELTTHRGHAGEIAARARAQGCPIVIVHGGDGTVNEVVNGLLDAPGDPIGPNPAPALAVIPGGSANVFARSLGIDPDPMKATAQLLTLLAERSRRRISLGHLSAEAPKRPGATPSPAAASGRWFLFNAGMGVDAEVVASIEDQRNAGKPASDARYIATTVRRFISASRRPPQLSVSLPGRDTIDDVHFVFVCNANPWTFIGPRPVWTNPDTTYECGLGVFASSSMSVTRNLGIFTQLLTGRKPHARHVLTDDDVASVRLTARAPMDVQMDGDYVGKATTAAFGCVRDRLEVVAPPLSA